MMTFKIETFILGPIENNTYLLLDSDCGKAAIVDPSIPSREVVELIREKRFLLTHILITHAHFDHIGGAKWFKNQFNGEPRIVLHQADLDLWLEGGGARDFGFDFDAGDQPDMVLDDEEQLKIGNSEVNVLFTPGHTSGHVTYHLPGKALAFCGDLIFFHGVGRTDLKTSDQNDLVLSIRKKIFSLPDETVLYPGHGPSTTVGEEKLNNPFMS
ncbi:MAG: MBL fold metallo-hydrolase [Chloroflexi bacterium]|nr:MBL fold metallo-hydrolase [Chloroflexota bacterium]